MKWIVYLLAVVVLVLHQDYWNFDKATLIWGWLPIGLAYHAAYSIVCAILMALLVATTWPKHLEKLENIQRPGQSSGEGH